MHQITDDLWISSLPEVRAELSDLDLENTAIVSIGDFPNPHFNREGFSHLYLGGVRDDDGKAFKKAIKPGIDFIDKQAKAGKRVIIHCAAGRNRSVSLLIAYLTLKKGWNFNRALSTIEAKRPKASPWPELTKVIKELLK